MHDWVTYALTKHIGVENEEKWKLQFGTIAWCAWRKRNELVFNGEEGRDEGPIREINQAVNDMRAAWNAHHTTLTTRKAVRGSIGWQLPKKGWCKVNTDGSRSPETEMAAAGGLIRDDEGNWLVGFTHLLGLCSATAAELWGIYNGMKLARDKG